MDEETKKRVDALWNPLGLPGKGWRAAAIYKRSYDWSYGCGTLKFEWDEAKNRANVRQHGLDFADAAAVFDGPMMVNADVREDHGEQRWIGVGVLRGRVVVLVFAEREPEVIRIISFRKEDRDERKEFEKTLQN